MQPSRAEVRRGRQEPFSCRSGLGVKGYCKDFPSLVGSGEKCQDLPVASRCALPFESEDFQTAGDAFPPSELICQTALDFIHSARSSGDKATLFFFKISKEFFFSQSNKS